LGTVWAAADSTGLIRVQLAGGRRGLMSRLGERGAKVDAARFAPLIRRIERMVNGRRPRFRERFHPVGTPFQRRVWRAIASIPWGETRSYAWLARKVGKPKAYRAVAQACGANPLPIIIPCHRVIASDGTIGGFSAGLRLKRRLLMLENISVK